MKRRWIAVVGGVCAAAALLIVLRARQDFRDQSPTSSEMDREGRGGAVESNNIGTAPSGAAESRPPRFVTTESPKSKPRFKPSAYDEMERSRKTNPTLSPADIYNEEKRDPIWAPAMERAMAERFSAAEIAALNLPGLKVGNLECRSSTCRISLEWPREVDNQLRKTGLIEQNRFADTYITQQQGPLAAGTMRLYPPEETSTGGRRVEYVTVFAAEDIDPADYRRRMDELRADNAKLREQLRKGEVRMTRRE